MNLFNITTIFVFVLIGIRNVRSQTTYLRQLSKRMNEKMGELFEADKALCDVLEESGSLEIARFRDQRGYVETTLLMSSLERNLKNKDSDFSLVEIENHMRVYKKLLDIYRKSNNVKNAEVERLQPIINKLRKKREETMDAVVQLWTTELRDIDATLFHQDPRIIAEISPTASRVALFIERLKELEKLKNELTRIYGLVTRILSPESNDVSVSRKIRTQLKYVAAKERVSKFDENPRILYAKPETIINEKYSAFKGLPRDCRSPFRKEILMEEVIERVGKQDETFMASNGSKLSAAFIKWLRQKIVAIVDDMVLNPACDFRGLSVEGLSEKTNHITDQYKMKGVHLTKNLLEKVSQGDEAMSKVRREFQSEMDTFLKEYSGIYDAVLRDMRDCLATPGYVLVMADALRQ